MRWYDLEQNVKKEKMNFEQVVSNFFDIFEDSIKKRMRSDVKIGSCLSGGLDSSSIVCMANMLLREQDLGSSQETVSSCFEMKKYDEQEYIDEVLVQLQIKGHKVFPQFHNLFKELDEITWHQDEPFGSTSIYSQWNVFKCAKENGLTVMLDGQGADEQLAGYDGYFTAYFSELFRGGHWIRLTREMNAFRKLFGRKKFNPIIGLGYSMLNGISPNLTWVIARKITSGSEIGWLKTEKFEKNSTIKQMMKKSQNSIYDNSVMQLLFTSVPALLHYEDRDSMAHSIESRVPFLDYRLVEFVLGLPSDCKIKQSKTKYVMREAMRGIIPDSIVNRHDKLGFMSPEEVWIRDNPEIFRQEIEDACEGLKSIVDKEKMLTWFDERLSSPKSFGYSFWKIISVWRWVKVFKVTV